MTLHELADQVAAMRAAQRSYFRSRTQGDLARSKALERMVDRALGKIFTRPLLPFSTDAKEETVNDPA